MNHYFTNNKTKHGLNSDLKPVIGKINPILLASIQVKTIETSYKWWTTSVTQMELIKERLISEWEAIFIIISFCPIKYTISHIKELEY